MSIAFNVPFAGATKPDTIDLSKANDIVRFQTAEKEGLTLIFPKGYVPLNKGKSYVKSPFVKHQLVSKTLIPKDRLPGEGWVFVALVLVFVLLLWSRRINPKKLVTYFSAFYNRRAQNELFEEENLLSSPFSLILFIAFCLTGSLFIVKAAGVVGFELHSIFNPIQLFGLFTLVLFISYSFKILCIQAIGVVFRQYPVARQYAFNVYLLNNILGLLLIPLVAVAYYSGTPTDLWAVYTAIVLFAVFFVLRFLKSLLIEGVMTPVNLMYLFLYLCTLEILPLIVAIKVVTSYL